MNPPQVDPEQNERRKHHHDRRGVDNSMCPLTPESAIEFVVTQKGLVTKVDGMEKKVNAMYDKMMQGKGILLGVRIGMLLAVSVFVVVVGSIIALISGKITLADLIAKVL